MIEILSTERLTLRGWVPEDFEAFAEFLGDDALCKHRGGAIDRIAASNFMSMVMGQWLLLGYGGYAIEHRASGDVVGMVGLWHPYDLAEPELYWSLYGGRQGKGYATEAAIAVRDWAIDVKNLSVMSYISDDNEPSIRVAERLGARRDPDGTLRGVAKRVYRHLRQGV